MELGKEFGPLRPCHTVGLLLPRIVKVWCTNQRLVECTLIYQKDYPQVIDSDLFTPSADVCPRILHQIVNCAGQRKNYVAC